MLVVKKLKDLRADAAARGGRGRMVKRVRLSELETQMGKKQMRLLTQDGFVA